MRRSHAPSIKKLPGGDGAAGGNGGGGGGEPAEHEEEKSRMLHMSLGESIVARRNAAAVTSGRCIVSREPLTNWLMVQQGRPVKTKFVSPAAALRTSQSDQLFKKMSIGMRKPQAHQFIRTKGMAGAAGFQPVLQDVTNLSGPEAGEEDAAPEADKPVAEEERTWEPLVLWSGEIETEGGETATHTIQVADRLCKVLRPHQREGVQFVFECVTGQRNYEGNGCILADDMGLGKTLQSIVVLHTLLKNGFKPGERIAKKALVVTPTSLIKNWANEIVKWLGDDPDLGVVAVTDSGKSVKIEINRFLSGPRNRILIISYETFRGHIKDFPPGCQGCCDLLICDEAHRLKNAETATNQSLNTLACRRRILLSGTPLQNDLNEFYAMVDFTNPGILGTPSQFRKNIVRHVLAGREPDATDAEVARAQECQFEMSNLVNEFILRRTNTLNAQHLPPKLVQVVCCRLTELQKTIYKHLLSSKEIRHIFEGKQTNILSSIGALQKLCNHPQLLQEASHHGSSTRGGGGGASYSATAANIGMAEIQSLLPQDMGGGPGPGGGRGGRGGGGGGGFGRMGWVRAELSGKMLVLERLMRQMRATGDERIVVVSNYTQTLDLIAALCASRGWPAVRLDGSTTVSKRQKLVDVFNDPASSSFAFLLSSKAGGCGINLIGANRLVMFDPDWNPAVDKQAAARVWREGQKRRCFIYRFLSTGTIEEKVFMRQLSKEGLQSIVDDKEEVNSLSSRDLQQLFKFDEHTCSDTHKKLRCKRCPKEMLQDKEAGYAGATAAAAGFSNAQRAAVREFAAALQAGPAVAALAGPLGALAEAMPNAEDRVDLLSLEEVLRRLDAGEYPALPAVAKHLRRQVAATEKAAAGEGGGPELQQAVYKFSVAFETGWRAMAASLINLRDDEGEGQGQDKKPEAAAAAAAAAAAGAGDGEEEGAEPAAAKFQPQVGMPLEEDLNNWSHHWTVETMDDPVMRDALLGAGGEDVVSFAFGLEVTWDLLQRFPQPSEDKEKKRKRRESMERKRQQKQQREEEAAAAKGKGKGKGKKGAAAAAAAAEAAAAKKKKTLKPAPGEDSSEEDSGSDSGSGSGGDSSSSNGGSGGDSEVEIVEEDASAAKRKPPGPSRRGGRSPAAAAGKRKTVVVDEEEESSGSESEAPMPAAAAAADSEGTESESEPPTAAAAAAASSSSSSSSARKRRLPPSSAKRGKGGDGAVESESDGEPGWEAVSDDEEEAAAGPARRKGKARGDSDGSDSDNGIILADPFSDSDSDDDDPRAASSSKRQQQKKKRGAAASLSPGKAHKKATPPARNADKSEWSCSSCTFLNPAAKRKCGICSAPAPAPTTTTSSRRRRSSSSSSSSSSSTSSSGEESGY